MANEITTTPTAGKETKGTAVTTAFRSGVQKATDTYSTSVISSLNGLGIQATPNQVQCIALGIQKMSEVLASSKDGKDWKDLDQSSVTDCLTQIALLEVNLASYPAEGYVAIKGNKMTFAPQGEGYRTLVEKFGRNVDRVYEPWLVKEGDDFKYPHFKGIEIEPPEWTPKGYGKCVRVVYPIKMTDGTIQYLISEREQVKSNLLAHVANNLRYNGSRDLYETLLKKAETKSLDELLHDSSFLKDGNVSPAWKEPNCESMVIRKMKNNVLKNFPKDTSSVVVANAIKEAESNDDESEPTPMATIDISTPKQVEDSIRKDLASDSSKKVADFLKDDSKGAKATAVKKEEATDDDVPF